LVPSEKNYHRYAVQQNKPQTTQRCRQPDIAPGLSTCSWLGLLPREPLEVTISEGVDTKPCVCEKMKNHKKPVQWELNLTQVNSMHIFVAYQRVD
jgi:hypothetical protein